MFTRVGVLLRQAFLLRQKRYGGQDGGQGDANQGDRWDGWLLARGAG